jgi:hypothetical protein
MRKATLTGATRVATAGASVLSFAAMVVAMGPLTGNGEEAATDDAPADDTLPTTNPPPTQPNVVIEVVPNYVAADGSAVPPDQLAATDEVIDPSLATDPAAETLTADPSLAGPTPAPSVEPVQAPASTVPTAAPTAAPTTAPPATAAPTTAAPATPAPTVAPTTAAPAPTAAPTTAPPATAPPTTAPPPPRSSASG